MRKLYCWMQAQKWKLLLVVVLSTINFVVVVAMDKCEKYLSTPVLVGAIGYLVYLVCRDYRNEQNISPIYLLGIVEIASVNFWNSDNVIFSTVCLWIRAILFLTVVVLSLIAIWLVRTKVRKNFFPA